MKPHRNLKTQPEDSKVRFLGGRVPTDMNSGVFGNEEWGMETVITSAFTEERERNSYGGT